MPKINDVVTTLRQMNDAVSKIGAETAKSLELIEELKNQVPDDAPQELVDAVEALRVNLQSVDDKVPDPVTVPAPESVTK